MEWRLIAGAGAHPRASCPVSVVVPDLAPDTPLLLREADSGREVPCQVGRGAVWWLLDELPAGRTRAYRMTTRSEPAASDPGCGLHDRTGEAVDFRIGGEPFTSYQYGARWTRPFLHPVLGPGGRRVTRAYPMEDAEGESTDHPHHKGVWVAHGDANGVNDWADSPGHGRIVHRRFDELASGPV